jgi:2-succinyl-5-enolpyruvyl-6-hydroxy-3-cyclohexene-1-carboxylate synthase
MTQYPKNKLAQLVLQSCVANGIENVVISPGSRNAPLTIGFVNHPKINALSIVDERSAAFFALGISQQTQKPTVVVCTSGSALLNYYPAVAEAFYSNIPLVIISADRPSHLIDIGDGQTIRQPYVFGNHILLNVNLEDIESPDITQVEYDEKTPVSSTDTLDNESLLAKAFYVAKEQNGPVHINVSFDEPLYQTVEEMNNRILDTPAFQEQEILIDNIMEESLLGEDKIQKLAEIWNSSSKKMILIGVNYPEVLLQAQLDKISMDDAVVVLTETTSNLHNIHFINGIDKVIFPMKDEELEAFKPDILLTLGGMIVSKKIKYFLRKFSPIHHWHIGSNDVNDTFFCLEYHFIIPPQLFLAQFLPYLKFKESNYKEGWLKIKSLRDSRQVIYLKQTEFSDLKAFEIILSQMPHNIHLQLANSSIIRYSQLFNVHSSLEIYCNRGTSGIEGSTSTAIGASYINKKQTVLITGDISFLYDSNALWNNYIKNDFRIILINNSGGGIFKFIPGPKSTNVLEYFETPHQLDASHLCKMYGLEYLSTNNEESLKEQLKTFYLSGEQPKLLEIFTPSEINDKVLIEYFKSL